jgi:predicted anti-sigma-YlaC factor YlaD
MNPCWHMKALLAARSDQKLSGLALRYVELHLSQCNQCTAALASLIALRQRLLVLREAPKEGLSPSHQQELQSALDERLRRHKGPPR